MAKHELEEGKLQAFPIPSEYGIYYEVTSEDAITENETDRLAPGEYIHQGTHRTSPTVMKGHTVTDNGFKFILDSLEKIEMARILAIRSALGLEIKTGMKMSNRYSTLAVLQNTGITSKRTKRGAYTDLNAYIVKILGVKFDRPL